jgi:type I restriction-modification system DNA methylase subunit
MPAKRKAAAPAPAKTLEVQLWDAANKMRGAVPPTDYMHVCLGLVFLRYLSAAFDRKRADLLATPHADAEDPEEYQRTTCSGCRRNPVGPRSRRTPAPRMSASDG